MAVPVQILAMLASVQAGEMEEEESMGKASRMALKAAISYSLTTALAFGVSTANAATMSANAKMERWSMMKGVQMAASGLKEIGDLSSPEVTPKLTDQRRLTPLPNGTARGNRVLSFWFGHRA